MTRPRSFAWSAICVATASLLLTGAMPSAPPDDAGHVAFVRQAVPKLLGRKPRGAEEVKLLADLADATGREAVLRTLMEEPEFIEHWTGVIFDDLRVQREDVANVTQAAQGCFGAPMRPGPPDAALARHVRNEPPTSPHAAGAFNMLDLIQSALVLDDVSPIFRAYPVALHQQLLPTLDLLDESPEKQEKAVGTRFSKILLNRDPSCLRCHNSRFSMSGADTGWDRTFAIPYALETAVYGRGFASEETQKKAFRVFRNDQFDPNSPGPWGLSLCGEVRVSLRELPPRDTSIAGLSGATVGITDLAKAFKEGVDSLQKTGPDVSPQSSTPATIPPAQGLAYLTAAAVVENVWKEVLGERLTIAHRYPRNQDQRDALKELVEQSFLESWSLKTLIVRIMTSDYFNRRSPDFAGSQSAAYRLPMILDPWVADDPREGPKPTDPRVLHNGQGELVHRHTPGGLISAIATALGWPAARRFLNELPLPDNEFPTFPNPELVRASGQYINESEQGRKGVDFQSLLFWESQLGRCRKPFNAEPEDWIDRVLREREKADAASPATPLTVGDVAATVKDWLFVDSRIHDARSGDLPSEREAVAELFGVKTLDLPAASVADLGDKLRAYCGVLLRTPQFLLTGIDPAGGELTFPRLPVCNGKPCSYGEMCERYAGTLARAGRTIECNASNRTLRQLHVASVPATSGAAKRGWAAFNELSKKMGKGPWFVAKPDESSASLAAQGHRALADRLPSLSRAEAVARLREYRSSKAFERSHPHLKKQ